MVGKKWYSAFGGQGHLRAPPSVYILNEVNS